MYNFIFNLHKLPWLTISSHFVTKKSRHPLRNTAAIQTNLICWNTYTVSQPQGNRSYYNGDHLWVWRTHYNQLRVRTLSVWIWHKYEDYWGGIIIIITHSDGPATSWLITGWDLSADFDLTNCICDIHCDTHCSLRPGLRASNKIKLVTGCLRVTVVSNNFSATRICLMLAPSNVWKSDPMRLYLTFWGFDRSHHMIDGFSVSAYCVTLSYDCNALKSDGIIRLYLQLSWAWESQSSVSLKWAQAGQLANYINMYFTDIR